MAMKGKEKAAAGKAAGEIFRVAGPVVTATGLRPRMYDVQFVGEEQLLGEVIQIVGEKTVIQVYEDTSGVRPGEAVVDTGGPLVVELGPGLLGSIYDGIQRPLPVLQKVMGDFILRGVKSPGLTREKSWAFAPKVQPGQAVGPGEANPRFPLTADMLTSRTVVKLVDPHEVAARIHHESVRCDTFARPEAARDRGGPALRDREQEVEDPLACDERDRGHESILHRPSLANGPGLVHLDLFPVVELCDDLVDLECALANLCDLPAAEVRGDHDSMLDVLRLLDRAHDLARAHRLTRLDFRSEGPRLLSRETRGLHPAEDEISHHLLEDRERPLDAVVDAPEEARAQLDDERPSRVHARSAVSG